MQGNFNLSILIADAIRFQIRNAFKLIVGCRPLRGCFRAGKAIILSCNISCFNCDFPGSQGVNKTFETYLQGLGYKTNVRYKIWYFKILFIAVNHSALFYHLFYEPKKPDSFHRHRLFSYFKSVGVKLLIVAAIPKSPAIIRTLSVLQLRQLLQRRRIVVSSSVVVAMVKQWLPTKSEASVADSAGTNGLHKWPRSTIMPTVLRSAHAR